MQRDNELKQTENRHRRRGYAKHQGNEILLKLIQEDKKPNWEQTQATEAAQIK